MFQKLKNIYHLFQSFLANVIYGFPGRKLKIIGVTGTSGKTTTTLMIYEILKKAGYKTSVLSSIQAVIGGIVYDTGFHVTTPDPHVLPKYLKKAFDMGDEYFILEVSSHALDQNRVAFTPFEVGVLTSFAHEHLDYHKTIENYAKAKFKLLHKAKIAILPADVLDKKLQKAVNYDKLVHKITTYGLNKADDTQEKWRLKLKLPGEFNLKNALAAAVVGDKLKIAKNTIKTALSDFSEIPGRFETIPNKKGLNIIIDFAHKPDALEAILLAVKPLIKKENKIICLYGCASERDTLKRPIMGKISGKLAEITVLTDEDPRKEDRLKIINEIADGCIQSGAVEAKTDNQTWINVKKHIFFKIPDRLSAIDFCINTLAKTGDFILLCGKGHEKSMNYDGVEHPWSEHNAVANALSKMRS